MASRFGVSSSVQGQTAEVVVTGEIGPDAAETLGYAVVAAVSEAAVSQVVVDLAAVTSIDDHGLEALATSQRAVEWHGCTLRIACPSQSVIDAAIDGLRRTGALRGHVQDAALRFLSASQAVAAEDDP